VRLLSLLRTSLRPSAPQPLPPCTGPFLLPPRLSARSVSLAVFRCPFSRFPVPRPPPPPPPITARPPVLQPAPANPAPCAPCAPCVPDWLASRLIAFAGARACCVRPRDEISPSSRAQPDSPCENEYTGKATNEARTSDCTRKEKDSLGRLAGLRVWLCVCARACNRNFVVDRFTRNRFFHRLGDTYGKLLECQALASPSHLGGFFFLSFFFGHGLP
jgi:hypothetical protein